MWVKLDLKNNEQVWIPADANSISIAEIKYLADRLKEINALEIDKVRLFDEYADEIKIDDIENLKFTGLNTFDLLCEVIERRTVTNEV